MALNKPQTGIIVDPERSMSIAELARGVREGRYEVKRIKKWNDGVYRLYLGRPDAYPDTYDIEALGGNVIVRFGVGSRRVLKRRNDAWITIPARLVKVSEGPVLVEWIDSKTLVVYLK